MGWVWGGLRRAGTRPKVRRQAQRRRTTQGGATLEGAALAGLGPRGSTLAGARRQAYWRRSSGCSATLCGVAKWVSSSEILLARVHFVKLLFLLVIFVHSAT